jgi:hypothetical protein
MFEVRELASTQQEGAVSDLPINPAIKTEAKLLALCTPINSESPESAAALNSSIAFSILALKSLAPR